MENKSTVHTIESWRHHVDVKSSNCDVSNIETGVAVILQNVLAMVGTSEKVRRKI